jgi:hypothetical protein
MAFYNRTVVMSILKVRKEEVDRVVSLSVRRALPIAAAARVRFQTRVGGICGGNIDIGAGFL